MTEHDNAGETRGAGRPNAGRDDRTAAASPRTKRQRRAELETALAIRRCAYCGTVGLWRVGSSPAAAEGMPRVRHIQCGACRNWQKLVETPPAAKGKTPCMHAQAASND